MDISLLLHARILIIDDQLQNVRLIEDLLRQHGYHQLRGISSPQQALEQFVDFQPDLVLLDLHMPDLDGFEVLDQIQSRIPSGIYLPVVMLTADITRDAKRRALAAGARDFVTKPIDIVELLLRIRSQLEIRFLHLELARHNEQLQALVAERTQELEQSRLEMLQRLARAVEYRDDETGEHTRRVGDLSARIAAALGVPADEVELIRLAAPLHDAGKIGIPDIILRKPGALTAEEYDLIKLHTTIGADLLADGHSKVIQFAEQIARSHHERWDGSGYPLGLAGEQIPLVGRIVAVADVFDALIHARPYKAAWPIDRALEQIHSDSGRLFDPAVVAAFFEVVQYRQATAAVAA
ncbi:MAG: response regulator [Oscillochloris sp.]|nr:response regulator [Oscillochloris sp.]